MMPPSGTHRARLGHMPTSMSPQTVLAQRLRRLRERRGWSQEQLASRLADRGLVWQRTTVAKVEAGSRQVTVDELVAVAFVIGVSPAALVVPPEMLETLAVTPSNELDAGMVWHWIAGQQVLGGYPADAEGSGTIANWAAMLRFYDESAPDFVALAERRMPGLTEVTRQVATLQREVAYDTALWGDVAAARIGEIQKRLKQLLSNIPGEARLSSES